jgi:serine/threonine-protein kinase
MRQSKAMTSPEEEAQGPDPLLGQLVGGKYQITKLLGEGGMGCVYVGEQQMGTTVRKVAVKTLHKHLSHDPQIKARFKREVGTVAALEHPNTIQVYDFGETPDGTLYIVMELVQGKSVAEIIETTGAMEPARVERILSQVCGSLEEAHGHGIVHRDLKPDNIVLCERAGQKDWVEVLDFGIAKRSNEVDEKEQKLTQQGMVLGTPPYMSPEQFTGQPIDARSDIYALGVMAYEMLTAHLPFAANTPWEWATQHMTAQPTPVEAQPNGGNIPPKMRDAIMKALSKNREDRFASVRDFFDGFSMGLAEASPLSMRGASAPAAQAVVGPPSGDGPSGGRAKTEIGAPLPAFAMGGGAPVGPAPMPAPVAYNAPAAIPAGPAHVGKSEGGGGGRGGLLVAAGVIGLITLAGVGAALMLNKKKTVVVAPPDLTSTTTAAASDSAVAGGDTHTPPEVAPLGSTAPLPGTPPVVAQGGGKPAPKASAATPATVVTLKPPGPKPTTAPPKVLTPETMKACQGAAMAKARGDLARQNALGAQCTAGGGSF